MTKTNKDNLNVFNGMFRRPKQFCWVLIGIGAVTPLIVGLVVKIYLMGQGESTIPLSRTIYFLPFALYWAIPFVLLAGFAYALLSWPQLHHGAPYWKRALIIGFGIVFGWVSMVVVFWIAWQPHGDLYLVAAPFMVGGAIVFGMAIGLIVTIVATYFDQR